MRQSFPKVKIIAVGKIKKGWLKAGIEIYQKRLPEVDIVEIKDAGKVQEAQKLQSLLKPRDRLILLTEDGQTFSSVQFARWLGQTASGKLVCFIGGPDGISTELKQAHPTVSLSAMTFPHEVARLLLLEQLYRAKTILQGGSYHK
ncbi:MAG: 23S rRNA (pseudouridine(1915)-N(3))-methyltransferase RlmH [Leptolyngbya sp. SIO4C1]|nr:23S rRNA (pseudouridine(1915)-N(3))-methyltransferase RlmH [Leptolyngbya sp. SIO4C1]